MNPKNVILSGLRIAGGLGGLLGGIWALARAGTRASEEGQARVAAGESRYQRHQIPWTGKTVR